MTSIDWGDGTTDSNLTHTYTAIGEYTCKIYGVTSIGSDTVGNDGRNGFLNCKPLTKLIIGNSVTKIGVWGVGRCDNLESVTIADSVKEIKSCAFAHCFNLTSVNIPKGLTSIPDYCFRETGLQSIEIPESVTSIGYVAFSVCSNLKTVTIKATTPPTLGEIAFGEGTSPTRMIVPIESLEAYKTAEGWKDYATLICSYVTSLDYASGTKAGVFKTAGMMGIDVNKNTGVAYIIPANKAQIDAKAASRLPITPENGDYFVKKGVTTNTETLTDEEKASAQAWLGITTLIEKLKTDNNLV
jgi:hypothetical protein